MQSVVHEMPEEIRKELEDHLNERSAKFNQMKEDNVDM